ncbi:NAD(P)/FAD-dependent oxidoreductase [Arthrobacter sp. R1-13]
MNNNHFSGQPETKDTVIIGGGQAGLTLGYLLARQQGDFVILDASERVGDGWRKRWDSLRLFTPAKFDGLVGMSFPGDRLAFPTKDEQADFLESYAQRFNLPVLSNTRVDKVERSGEGYLVTAGDRQWSALNVVVATGPEELAKLPSFAQDLSPTIRQMHSTEYRSPGQLQEGPVLVVGAGNSGAEIAFEVVRSHPTLLSGSPSAELPFKHGRNAARFALPLVRFAGLHILNLDTPIGRKAAPGFLTHSAPLIRTRMRDLAAAGVEIVPRITGIQDGVPLTAEGNALEVSNVIWCTGYRHDYSWLDVPGALDANGVPVQRRGVAETSPGLYFLGLEFLYCAASSSLPGVGRDAKYLAEHLATRQAAAAGQRQDVG